MRKFCKIHGEYYEEKLHQVGLLMLPVGCPICNAEREKKFKEQEARDAKIRDQERALHEKALLQKRGIEPEFYGVTLDDYKVESDCERKAVEATQALIDGRIKKLVLLGSFGTGKTMLASILAILLGGIRITMFEISARIRAMYNNHEGTEVDVLDDLLSYPLIAIDEIGRTKGSEAELNWLSYLIDKAHTRKIPLVLISNKQRARNLPPEKRGDCFESYLPNDSLSRLKQETAIIELYGKDRRGDLNADIL